MFGFRYLDSKMSKWFILPREWCHFCGFKVKQKIAIKALFHTFYIFSNNSFLYRSTATGTRECAAIPLFRGSTGLSTPACRRLWQSRLLRAWWCRWAPTARFSSRKTLSLPDCFLRCRAIAILSSMEGASTLSPHPIRLRASKNSGVFHPAQLGRQTTVQDRETIICSYRVS